MLETYEYTCIEIHAYGQEVKGMRKSETQSEKMVDKFAALL